MKDVLASIAFFALVHLTFQDVSSTLRELAFALVTYTVINALNRYNK